MLARKRKDQNTDLQHQVFLHPKPIGCRIKHFLHKWRQITSDKWILNIIQYGYCIKIIKMPPNKGPRRKIHSKEETTRLLKEVEEILAKDSIELVLTREINKGN